MSCSSGWSTRVTARDVATLRARLGDVRGGISEPADEAGVQSKR